MNIKYIKKNILVVAFILISAISITGYTFAEPVFKAENKVKATTSNNKAKVQRENVELYGQIGEWNPNDLDSPQFGDEVDGNKPNTGEYFTISVTVPLNMEFTVLPNSQSGFGYFSSPKYNIKNNGTKTIDVKVGSFTQSNTSSIDKDVTPLYVAPIVKGDKKTQMELKLSAIDNKTSNEIDLYRLSDLNYQEKLLYKLRKNEIKEMKFSATHWELPWFESNKSSAVSNYTIGFEFSIASPNGGISKIKDK